MSESPTHQVRCIQTHIVDYRGEERTYNKVAKYGRLLNTPPAVIPTVSN